MNLNKNSLFFKRIEIIPQTGLARKFFDGAFVMMIAGLLLLIAVGTFCLIRYGIAVRPPQPIIGMMEIGFVAICVGTHFALITTAISFAQRKKVRVTK